MNIQALFDKARLLIFIWCRRELREFRTREFSYTCGSGQRANYSDFFVVPNAHARFVHLPEYEINHVDARMDPTKIAFNRAKRCARASFAPFVFLGSTTDLRFVRCAFNRPFACIDSQRREWYRFNVNIH